MSTNPLNVRLPQFDLETAEGRQLGHRYNAQGIVDLNQAIVALNDKVNGMTVTPSTAQTGSSISPNAGIIPGNTPAISSEWIDSYDASVGMFHQSQPAVSDISGLAADLALLAPLASPTFTGTVTQPNPTVVTAATTATTATAGAATLPTNPLGFVQVSINGVTVKIPYYSV